MNREPSIGKGVGSAAAASVPHATVGKQTQVAQLGPVEGASARHEDDAGDYQSVVGQHVAAMRAWDDAAIAARRAALQGQLTTTKDPKARAPLVHEYEAIEWVARERGIALPKDPREQAAPQGYMGGKPVKFWAPDDAQGMRGLLEREMASGTGYDAAKGDALARVNYATPSRSPEDQAKWKLGQDQAALMDQDATAFRAAFQAEAKHEALAMLSASTVAIDTALRSYGIAGGDFRLTEAARKVAHDPGALDAEVANWVALSHHLDKNKPALAAGHGRRDDLAREADHLRALQDSIALLSSEQHQLVAQLGTDCTPRASTRAPKIESLTQPAPPASPFAVPKPAAQSPQQHLAFVQGALKARQAQFRAAWLEAERAHPVLAAYRGRNAPDAHALPGRGTDDDTLHSVIRQVLPKLANIYRTKAALQGGALDPLQLAPVVELTKHRLFVAEGSYRDRAVHDMAVRAHERHGGPIAWALDAILLGLTMLTLVPTGGTSALLALSLTGLAYDLHAGLHDYADLQLTTAATDTDLDAFHSLSNTEPSLAPLVLRLLSAGVNLAVATSILKRAIALRHSAIAHTVDPDAVTALNQAGEQLGVTGIGDESVASATRSNPAAAGTPQPPSVHSQSPQPQSAQPQSPHSQSAPPQSPHSQSAPPQSPHSQSLPSSTQAQSPVPPSPQPQSPAPPSPLTSPQPPSPHPSSPQQSQLPQPLNATHGSVQPAPALAAAPNSQRVTGPVSGVYEDLDPNFQPAGWQIREDKPIGHPVGHPELLQATTNIIGPNGRTGWIQRSYNAQTRTLIMENAFLQDLPKWIDAGTPLISGRGTPTVTYLSLRQMKLLGARFGELEVVKMSTIQNVEAIMQLEQLVRLGKSMDAAVAATHSVKYATTAIEQSGHTITSIHIDTRNSWKWPMWRLMDYFHIPTARQQELFKQYGLTKTDEVLMNYDILINVSPYPVVP